MISLDEAGAWAACRSKAWDNKILVKAFWVWGSQVSKTPESGEFVPTGSFIIRGRKNMLTPTKLELGYTILFMMDEESMKNHTNERKVRSLMNEDSDSEDELPPEEPLEKQESVVSEEAKEPEEEPTEEPTPEVTQEEVKEADEEPKEAPEPESDEEEKEVQKEEQPKA